VGAKLMRCVYCTSPLRPGEETKAASMYGDRGRAHPDCVAPRWYIKRVRKQRIDPARTA
jgi:hypothetical protein